MSRFFTVALYVFLIYHEVEYSYFLSAICMLKVIRAILSESGMQLCIAVVYG